MNRVDHAQNGHAVGDDCVSTMDVKRQFDAAVNVIRNLPATPSKDGKLHIAFTSLFIDHPGHQLTLSSPQLHFSHQMS